MSSDKTHTTAEILVDRLLDWGVDTIFGLPGDGINGIMEALRVRQDRVRFIHVRHEKAAAFMACCGLTGPITIKLFGSAGAEQRARLMRRRGAWIASVALVGACHASSVPVGTSPAPSSPPPGLPPVSAVEEQQRLLNAIDSMPSPAAPFTFVSKTPVRGANGDVRFRYNGPDSIYVDMFVYALQGPHPYPCAARCIDSLAEQDFQEYFQAIPYMIRAKYWDEIVVAARDTIPPANGAAWQSARRIRMVARKNGRTMRAERLTFYFAAYRVEVRADLPETSPHQPHVDAFVLDLARRMRR